MKAYLDSSAAAKLVLQEAEAIAFTAWLDAHAGADLTSSVLLVTELHRATIRAGLPRQGADDVLDRVTIVALPRGLARFAGVTGPSNLRSLDAIHVATALQEDVDLFIAYDRRLQQAARAVGLAVAAPV